MVRLRELQDPILRMAQRLLEAKQSPKTKRKHSPITYKTKPKHSPITYKTKPKHSPRSIMYKTKQRRRVKQPQQRRLVAPLPDEYVAEPKVEEEGAVEEAAAEEAVAEEEAAEPENYIPPEEMEEL